MLLDERWEHFCSAAGGELEAPQQTPPNFNSQRDILDGSVAAE